MSDLQLLLLYVAAFLFVLVIGCLVGDRWDERDDAWRRHHSGRWRR